MYKILGYGIMYGLLGGIIWDEFNYLMRPYITYYNEYKLINKGFYLGLVYGFYRSIKK